MRTDLNVEDMLKMVKSLRDMGMHELEVDGMKLKFNAQVQDQMMTYKPIINPFFKESDKISGTNIISGTDIKAEDLVKPLSIFEGMTDEEILYYATPYYDQLQANKKAHEEKLREEEVLK